MNPWPMVWSKLRNMFDMTSAGTKGKRGLWTEPSESPAWFIRASRGDERHDHRMSQPPLRAYMRASVSVRFANVVGYDVCRC